MRKSLHAVLFLFSMIFFLPTGSIAQEQFGTQLGNWQNNSLPEAFYGRYNEVWGVIVNGVEYGVIGSTMGTHFISLEPDANGNLEEIAFVEGGATGTSLIHRDFHHYGNYIYAVADEGFSSTLQIIDYSNLPTSVTTVYDSNEFFVTAHNIFIDEDNARLYTSNGEVLSLADPTNPTLLHENGYFSHDIFVQDNIVFSNEGNNGMRIYDYTDASNPVTIGSLTNYVNSGYNHSGWISEDGDHYFLCDETGGSFVKSLDITNLSDIEVVDMYKADNDNPNHIAHNALVLGDKLYVSYYTDGLAVFDVTDPTRVVRKYAFDTYPGVDDSGFKGAWGVYPFLPSGRMLVSDLNSGFYLIELPADQTVFALDEDILGCASTDFSFDILIGTDFTSNVNISESGLPSGATITYSENPATPGSIVGVTIGGISSAMNFDLQVMVDDGNANSSMMVPLEILSAPQAATLAMPADGSTDVEASPVFTWSNTGGVEKLIEISSFADFSTVDILSQTVFTETYTLQTSLTENSTYYWRVSFEDDCGQIVSDIFSFQVGILDGIDDIIAGTVSISPNPVLEEMLIETGEYFQGDIQINLVDLDGKNIQSWNVFNANEQFGLTAPKGLAGLFLLQISDAENTLTKKIFFGK